MRDRDVRTAVRKRLEAEHLGDPDTLIVDEMGVWSGTVRIDIAVINGEICGYELKSDRDTLTRLPLQADVYSRVFDKVTLVVGERHSRKAREVIPKWWGVTLARYRGGELCLIDDRNAKQNPRRDPYLVAELLTKEESVGVLEQFDLAAGWRSKRVREIHNRLATELPLDVLSERVRSALRTRQNWLGNNCPGVLNVPVDAVADPLRQPPWGGRSSGDCIDDAIAPAMAQTAPAAIANDALCVPLQLDVHIDPARTRRTDPSADEV